MEIRYKMMIAALCLPLLLVSCGKEEATQAQAPKQAAHAGKAQAAAGQGIETAAALHVTAEHPARNPFQSHIVLMKGAEAAVKKVVKGPLECCELSLFRLMAVVSSSENSFALVLSPDSKRYVIRRGDKIGSNEGKVIKIGNNKVTVREPNKDEKGNILSTTDTEMTLPTEKANERVPGRR
ncbi:MAG: pilus assembly protein PilP [Deltaproteobacteria bacterium]